MDAPLIPSGPRLTTGRRNAHAHPRRRPAIAQRRGATGAVAGSGHGGRGHHRHRSRAGRVGGGGRGGRRRPFGRRARSGGFGRAWAARPGGRSGGCSWSTHPSNAGCGSRTRPTWPCEDWLGSAGFDRPEDHWPREWAKAYVDFAAGEKRSWLKAQGIGLFPVVQWAERGGYEVGGHGNSVPRFHVTWGSGPGRGGPVRQAGRRARPRRPGPTPVPASGHRTDRSTAAG